MIKRVLTVDKIAARASAIYSVKTPKAIHPADSRAK